MAYMLLHHCGTDNLYFINTLHGVYHWVANHFDCQNHFNVIHGVAFNKANQFQRKLTISHLKSIGIVMLSNVVISATSQLSHGQAVHRAMHDVRNQNMLATGKSGERLFCELFSSKYISLSCTSLCAKVNAILLAIHINARSTHSLRGSITWNGFPFKYTTSELSISLAWLSIILPSNDARMQHNSIAL